MNDEEIHESQFNVMQMTNFMYFSRQQFCGDGAWGRLNVKVKVCKSPQKKVSSLAEG